MTRLNRPELYLANLYGDLEPGQRGYMSKERAHELLKEYTGKDFGYDVRKWSWYLQKEKWKRYLKTLFTRS